MRVIDLTHTIEETMPVFPGTEPPKLRVANTYEKDGFQETLLSLSSHTGTHIDAPAHLFPGRTTLDAFPAEQFVGRALVIDCRHLKPGEAITRNELQKYGEKVKQADFLLFHLGWAKFWGPEAYFGDYPCIDDGVMHLILDGNFKGIGFDVISPDPIAGEALARHRALFAQKDIINIENLKNLDLCGDALFRFVCLPIKVQNSDGAPCRAIAWLEDETEGR